MSIRTNTASTTYSITALPKATQAPNNKTELKSHHQQGGRYFLEDPDTGEQINVSRLTAYAEFGEEIHERDAHHEIPLLKVDAPKFLDALTREEHTRYHKQNPDPVEQDGYPVFRAGL